MPGKRTAAPVAVAVPTPVLASSLSHYQLVHDSSSLPGACSRFAPIDLPQTCATADGRCSSFLFTPRHEGLLGSFPQTVTFEIVLLWNAFTNIRAPVVYPSTLPGGLSPPSSSKVLHTDPHPSPVPDSGNLHPAHFIIPRPSLLQIVPAQAGQNSTSLTTPPLRLKYPSRPRKSRRRRRPRPKQGRNSHHLDPIRDRVTASIPRSRPTTATILASKLPGTKGKLGSWTNHIRRVNKPPTKRMSRSAFYCSILTRRVDRLCPYDAFRMKPEACPIP